MLGRILNTLSHRVNKEEKEWKSKSDLRKEYEYGSLRGTLIYCSRKPVKWAFIILTVFGILTFAISRLPAKWLILVKSEFNTSDLISYFSILWSVQATIVALIYPIVIAFVALLLQRRHKAKSYLNIYLHDTAALLSGLCAIGLIFLMAIQYFFIPILDTNVTMSWLFTDALFFLLNLSLTAYFLYQTFEYIKPMSRLESLKKYLINVIWPEEFKYHLSALLFSRSINEKLLNVQGVDRNINSNEKPSIWTQRDLSSGLGESKIEKELPKDSELVDVRFRLLSFVAKRWANKAKNKNQDQSHILVFPLNTGIKYSGPTTLCKIQGSTQLSSFHKWLIKRSLKFKKKSNNHKLQVDDLLDDLCAEVLRSLRSGETQIFSEALDDLIEFITILIKASAFENAEAHDNYSRIVNPNQSLFGRSIYKNWFKRIINIYEPATDRIISDDAYISELIHVPQWLFLSIKETAHVDILKELLVLAKYLNYRIADWWIKTIENQGITVHDKCTPATLQPPYNGTYAKILRSYIGQWEGLKNRFFIPRNKEEHSWSLLQSNYPLFELHLRITSELLLDSIYKGDKSRSKYLLDTLLKWCSGLQFQLDRSARHLVDDSQWINLEHLELQWDEIDKAYNFEHAKFGNHEPPNLIFSIAIENYWTDICCVLLYKLAKNTLRCEEIEESLIADTYRAIFYGKHPLKTGNSITANDKPVKDANHFFESLIRQYYSGFYSDQQYRRKLDNITEKISPSWDSSVIPGRVYSSNSREDLSMLRDGMLLTLTLLVQNKWNPVQKYNQLIKQWITENLQQIEIFVRDLEGVISRVQDQDFDKFKSVYDTLSEDNSQNFKDALEVVRKGLEEFKEKIESVRLDLTKSLKIDEEKLNKIEEWSSEKPFNQPVGVFPIPLFHQITITKEEHSVHTWLWNGLKKGWFTEPLMALHGPDENLYKDLLIERIPNSIWAKTLTRLSLTDVKTESAQDYWEKIKEYESTLTVKGKTPILIINSISDPRWIRNWINLYGENNEDIPKDLEFSKKEEIKLRTYVGHFNKTEVHKSNTFRGAGTSILMAKESFKKLQVTQNDNGNLISVLPEGNDDPTKVDLNFIWKFEVTIEPINALLLKCGELEN